MTKYPHMENIERKYWDRLQAAKKKTAKYRDIIIELRAENRQLKEEQSCAGSSKQYSYTCEENDKEG